MPTTNEQYIGSGIVYAGGRDVGNVSKLALSIETDSKTRPNYRGGGGNAADSLPPASHWARNSATDSSEKPKSRPDSRCAV